MEVEVDWLGIVVAAAAVMVISSLWYSKMVFGKTWQKLVGLKDSDMQKGAGMAIAKAAVLSLLTAYVLSHLIYLSYSFYDLSWVQTGLTTAFWVWLGFVFTWQMMNGAFEQRPNKLVLINVSNQLVNLLVMGAILGYFFST